MHLLSYFISNLFVHLNTLLITILSSLSGISANSHSLDGIAVGLIVTRGVVLPCVTCITALGFMHPVLFHRGLYFLSVILFQLKYLQCSSGTVVGLSVYFS